MNLENPYASPRTNAMRHAAASATAVRLVFVSAVVAVALTSLSKVAGAAAVKVAFLSAGPSILFLGFAKKKCSPTAFWLILGAVGGAAVALVAECLMSANLAAQLRYMSPSPIGDWTNKSNATYLRDSMWAVGGPIIGACAGALAATPHSELRSRLSA